MKALTTAKTVIINVLLAVAVMVPATQAQAGWKGELEKLKNKYQVTVTVNKNGATIKAHKRVTKPSFSSPWSSSLGKISFQAGYYSCSNKISDGGYLMGRLIKMQDGRYAFVGKFGKVGKVKNGGKRTKSYLGTVKFVFNRNGKSFQGYSVSSKNGQKKAWNGTIIN